MENLNVYRISELSATEQKNVRFFAEAAYVAYPTSANPKLEGYTFVKWLTGATPMLEDINSEDFVAVFKSGAVADEYLFAFKGSATKWDWWEDIKIEFAKFPFFNADNNDFEVEIGFKDIYVTSVSDNKKSLQYQLFEFLGNTKITSLKISGHSLGSALAELFTYDILKSSGCNKPKTIQHINFACPKVLNYSAAEDFRSLLTNQNSVLRIVNQHDMIPNWPNFGEEELSFWYYHATDFFLMDFWKKDEKFPDWFYVYHSIINYKKVINTINMTLPVTDPQDGECWGIDINKNTIVLQYDIPNE